MCEKALVIVLLLSLLQFVLGQQCTEDNCKLPDCRCFDTKDIPGGLTEDETPMIITVTFEDALTPQLADYYSSFFGIINPNGCPTRGTFFIKDQFTDYNLVKAFYDQGHEFGIQSLDGTKPADAPAWNDVIQKLLQNFESAGLARGDILGVRGPEMRIDGNNEFIGLGDNNLLYDTTCTSVKYSGEGNTQWPFTYDFVPGPDCDNGAGPDMVFQGKWEYLVSGLEWNNVSCATPAACTGINTKQDAFDLFFTAFEKHYKTRKAPFNIVINPVWVTADYNREGTIEFLDYVRAAFPDVWIVTVTQALQWVQTPTAIANITDFPPWQC